MRRVWKRGTAAAALAVLISVGSVAAGWWWTGRDLGRSAASISAGAVEVVERAPDGSPIRCVFTRGPSGEVALAAVPGSSAGAGVGVGATVPQTGSAELPASAGELVRSGSDDECAAAGARLQFGESGAVIPVSVTTLTDVDGTDSLDEGPTGDTEIPQGVIVPPRIDDTLPDGQNSEGARVDEIQFPFGEPLNLRGPLTQEQIDALISAMSHNLTVECARVILGLERRQSDEELARVERCLDLSQG